MANNSDKALKTDIESKVAVVDGERAVVQKLPDGTARMVIADKTDESAEEE